MIKTLFSALLTLNTLFLFTGNSIINAQLKSVNNSHPYYHGVNYLQTSNVSLNSFTSMQSLQKIKQNGANTVAFVIFLEQASPDSSLITASNAVTDNQLTQAIADAHNIHLRVILKPQVLILNSWAGEINPKTAKGWQQWHDNYQQLIVHYAKIAQRYNVEVLLLGTELRLASIQPQFRQLIMAVRQHFHGEISYAAHGIDGMKRFPYWDLLDSVSLTLYPSLGNSWDLEKVSLIMSQKVNELESFIKPLKKKLWIAEVGLSSEQNSYRHPWLVTKKNKGIPNMEIQAKVLGLWLKHLQQPWIQGAMIWNWSSDTNLGGINDTGFTIQNKTAEGVVKCYWQNNC